MVDPASWGFLSDIANAFRDVKEKRKTLSPEQLKARIDGEIETAKNRKNASHSEDAKRAAPGLSDRSKANSMLVTAYAKLVANTVLSGTDAIKSLFPKNKDASTERPAPSADKPMEPQKPEATRPPAPQNKPLAPQVRPTPPPRNTPPNK